jgi:sialic acid synthase SpsE
MTHKKILYKIKNKKIGNNEPCFIIAEIGSNHNNNIKLAKKTILAAAKSGADAVKFQTFKAESHYSKYTPGFKYLKKINTFKLIKKLELNRSWQKNLKKYSEKLGLVFFSSPCDFEAVDQLNDLNVQIHKIASFDITDKFLIKKIAESKKIVIISTGMANHDDIKNAIKTCLEVKNSKIILLQCTSLYPAPSKLSNLLAINSLYKKYNFLTGFSDHTIGDHNAVAAVALGAKVLEKHFTLSRKQKGPDHKFAMEPEEFKIMVKKIREIEIAIGDGKKIGPAKEEIEMFKKGRRSIHAIRNLKKGSILKLSDLIVKRPSFGISSFKINKILGKKIKKNIKQDQWIKWGMI